MWENRKTIERFETSRAIYRIVRPLGLVIFTILDASYQACVLVLVSEFIIPNLLLTDVMDDVYRMTGCQMVGLTAWTEQTRPLCLWMARWTFCNQRSLLSPCILTGDDLPAGLCPMCRGCVVSIIPLSGVSDGSHQTMCWGGHGTWRVQRLYSRISQSSMKLYFLVKNVFCMMWVPLRDKLILIFDWNNGI